MTTTISRDDVAFTPPATSRCAARRSTRPSRPALAPAVVMAHGFGAVRAQYLHHYAERFAAAGLRTLVYDHRGFGDSEGAQRQDIDPWLQVRDFQHTLSDVRSRPDVDGERVGVWGTSFSGGPVLVLGAVDARVRAVVAQVPTISGSEAARRRVLPHLAPAVVAAQIADREAVYGGASPQLRPLVEDGSGQPPVYAGPGARGFMERAASRPATFVNAVTLQSLARTREYEPGSRVARISPTPLLMLVTTRRAAPAGPPVGADAPAGRAGSCGVGDDAGVAVTARTDRRAGRR